jgi:predicted phage gp36 major capsid-like protein
MFTLDTTIDAVQTAKKQFVNTVFAQNKTIADALNGFVDAQAAYTKAAMAASTKSATTLASEAVKLTQEAAKMDLTKFDLSKFNFANICNPTAKK